MGRRQISVCRAGRPHRRLGTARATAPPGGGAVHAVRHRHRAGPARRGPGRGGRAGRRAAHAGQDAHGPVHDLRAVRAVPRGASERAVRAARPGAHPGGAYRRASRSRKQSPEKKQSLFPSGKSSARPGGSRPTSRGGPRMRAHAKEAAREVAQMGGAAPRRGRGVEAQRHARRDRRAARRGRGEDAGQRVLRQPAPTRRATPPRTPRAPPARTTARARRRRRRRRRRSNLPPRRRRASAPSGKRETPPNAL